jgi:hypothetical protein
MIATALDPNNIESVIAALHTNAPSQVTGHDINGEFSSPLEGALWMAGTYQIPQIPLNGKVPFFPQWPMKASTDPTQIRAWWDQYRGNFGSLAVPGRHFIFEADSPAVRERFKAQGHDFTAKLIIESRQGGHRYYLSAPGIENIAQHAVKYADFSIRADGEQCVSPGSVHPISGKQYRVASSGPLAAPASEEISFWTSERKEKAPTIRDAQAMIRDGQRLGLHRTAKLAKRGCNARNLLALRKAIFGNPIGCCFRALTHRWMPELKPGNVPFAAGMKPILWTDDYSSLWGVIRQSVLNVSLR